ncbi:MAG: L,D-transpeptidase family protein [Rhodospirillaceae bacterium]
MFRIVPNLRIVALAAAACLVTLPAAGATYRLYSPDQHAVGHLDLYVTGDSDVLLDVARSHGFGFTEFMASNRGTAPWFPPDGTPVILPGMHFFPDAPREGVVINLAAHRLFYFPKGKPEVITFPIGIGRIGVETPLGSTQVVRKAADPIWFPTPAHRAANPNLPAAVAPGPSNPLGRFALYLGWPHYLVHGTNKPDGIGRTVSSGCIRLFPEDIEQIYNLVPVGTPVHVVSQEAVTAWIGDKLFAQVFPNKEQAEEIGVSGEFATRIPSTDLVERIIAATSAREAAIDWNAVEQAGLERTGLPVLVGRALPQL